MPKGKPLSDETKKKISEALKKKFGSKEEVQRSDRGQAYYDRYANSRMDYEAAKADRDAANAAIKALKGKKGTAQRKKLKAAAKEANARMKEASKQMRAAKTGAQGEKSKVSEGIWQEKAKARVNQYALLVTKITDLASKTDSPSRRARLNAQLKRALEGKTALEKKMSMAPEQRRAIASPFNFSEQFAQGKLPRPLTMQETRINFVALNETFDNEQDAFANELTEITNAEIDRASKQAESRISVKDIAAIAGIAFLIRGAVDTLMRKTVKKSYDIGKTLAANEMGIAKPTTPLIDTQLMNLDADDIADGYTAILINTFRATLKAGVAADASTPAIIAAARARTQDAAANAITNIRGTVVGQYLNRGRDMVFTSHQMQIVSYQRSEVLDISTCGMCWALDKKVITPDDPMRNLEIVHSHCRGLWVPIFGIDETKPDVTGIPKTLLDKFDLIDGRPTINAFKNIKAPVNEQSKDAAASIRKKLK